FTWTVTDVTTPAVTNPGAQSGNEGDSVSLQIVASDADGDPLTFSASGLPTGLSIDTGTGLISGTLDGQSAGSHSVTVTASDRSTSDIGTFTWTVTDVTAPALTNPGAQSGNEGDSVSLQIVASDADGDPLTYSASGLPSGLSIDTGTGLISGILGGQSAGS